MELVKKIESLNILKKISIVLFGTLLLTISAKIKVPFYPVPMTMQTFVVVLIGITLGWKLGLATVFAYLFEGAIGLPVFAGTPEKGIGISYMLGPTGGYLLGFLSSVFIAGFVNLNKNIIIKFFSDFAIYISNIYYWCTLVGLFSWMGSCIYMGYKKFCIS